MGAGAVLTLLTGCNGVTQSAPKASSTAAASKGKAQTLAVQTTGHAATWTDRDKHAHTITVTPKSLVRAAASDLDHVRLDDDDLKGKTPYYLTVTYTNTSKDTLAQPSMSTNLALVSAGGTRAKSVMVMNNPTLGTAGQELPCTNGDPDTLPAGGTAEACTVLMLDPKLTPATVAYADDSSDTVLWNVGDGNSSNSGLLPPGTTVDAFAEDLDKHQVPIKVTPKSIRQGSLDDLSNVKLDDRDRNTVPYYVTVEYRNMGQSKLLPVLQDNLTLQTAGGHEIPKMTLLFGEPGVEPCPGPALRTRLEPGGTLTQCTIHMIPKGDRPATISYQGSGTGDEEHTWRAVGNTNP
ncbi:hypothetical protein [Streptomyces morookaense]|uniref:Uncharacterized protein n=2 Tax=Streptomyces TaxID=1883 RepID=A0A7Y7B6R0_STRMO|nr:hypothetical protein [Streptomyces morookaense]NVK80053.1 hypothetical protein [Streptomyces morookaense]GHF41853.1 hypothetical protein GCM10010359_50670 [Streptomyces morookaense]